MDQEERISELELTNKQTKAEVKDINKRLKEKRTEIEEILAENSKLVGEMENLKVNAAIESRLCWCVP